MAKQVVVITMLVEGKPDALGRLGGPVQKAKSDAKLRLNSLGYSVVGAEATIGHASKDICITLTPPRIHFGLGNIALCTDQRRPKRRITPDWEKVTCRNCLKHKPMERPAQVELFAQ